MNRIYGRRSIAQLGIIVMLILTLVMLVSIGSIANVYAEEKYYNDLQVLASNSSNSQTFSYTRYEESINVTLDMGLPNYYDIGGYNTNECTAVAGANIIAYYSYFYPQLMPTYSATYNHNGVVKYKPMFDDEQQSLIDSLYYSMDVNVNKPGATEADFKRGLTFYAWTAGLTLGYTQLKQNGSVNVSQMVAAINRQEPIAILCTLGSVIKTLNIGDTSATFVSSSINTNHVMAVSGIKQVRYYNGNTNFRTDTYLAVSIGINGYASSYVLLSSIPSLESALAVNVR